MEIKKKLKCSFILPDLITVKLVFNRLVAAAQYQLERYPAIKISTKMRFFPNQNLVKMSLPRHATYATNLENLDLSFVCVEDI